MECYLDGRLSIRYFAGMDERDRSTPDEYEKEKRRIFEQVCLKSLTNTD